MISQPWSVRAFLLSLHILSCSKCISIQNKEKGHKKAAGLHRQTAYEKELFLL